MASAASPETRLQHLFWIPPALLFISAALTKSLFPIAFLNELANYNLSLPLSFQALTAIFLPALEMILGMTLLLRPSRIAAVGLGLLLVIFSIGIITALPAGYLHRCGCMGPETVDPFLALIKNGLAMLLLIGGFLPYRRQLKGANPWAAFGLIAGASWTGGGLLVVYALGCLLAWISGSRHLLGYLLALLLGLVLHLANFPLLACLAIATVLYFIYSNGSSRLKASPAIMSLVILSLSTVNFIWPRPPESPNLLLKIGQPWPRELRTETPSRSDSLGRCLVIFLRTDCDECRDWMPRAIRFSRNDSLPPLTGLAPQSPADLAVYRRRENIPFPVYSVEAAAFDRAVRRTPMLVLVQHDTVRQIFEEGGLPNVNEVEFDTALSTPPSRTGLKIYTSPLKGAPPGVSTSVDSNRVAQGFNPGRASAADQSLVLWVTGGLHGQWLPHAPYGQPLAGGVSRIARALDLYRQRGDLLVDLGQFRYPLGVSGETRTWRIRANGFLKTMVRMSYSAISVSPEDAEPSLLELQARASEYGLPLANGIVEKAGLSILSTNAPESQLDSLAQAHHGAILILWLNAGSPVVKEINGMVILGLGDNGDCLGRIEIRDAGGRLTLDQADLSGWTDGQPWRHHPARENLLEKLHFGKKPNVSAYLWQVPEALTPEKQAETQRTQTVQELSDYYDLQDLHRRTPGDFAGPDRCRNCHNEPHPRNLMEEHRYAPPQVLAYPVYERCLGCHATGFDQPGGFLEPSEHPDLLGVACEACHGPQATHAIAGGYPAPGKPDSLACLECHDAAKRPDEHPK